MCVVACSAVWCLCQLVKDGSVLYLIILKHINMHMVLFVDVSHFLVRVCVLKAGVFVQVEWCFKRLA